MGLSSGSSIVVGSGVEQLGECRVEAAPGKKKELVWRLGPGRDVISRRIWKRCCYQGATYRAVVIVKFPWLHGSSTIIRQITRFSTGLLP